jgi:ribosomal protein S18 acetylase RimI-like enzyme
MTIVVRRATVADASRLSEFAATTFRETFAADNTVEHLARYLAEAFSPERQAAEITDPAGDVLLAERGEQSGAEDLLGYVHLVSGTAPPAVQGPAPLEIRRLYVGRAWHGHGIAQALMNAALAAARARGAQTVWLGVWERNPRAAAFYGKYGFTRVGQHTFMLGGDAQTDWVLVRPIGMVPRPGHGEGPVV